MIIEPVGRQALQPPRLTPDSGALVWNDEGGEHVALARFGTDALWFRLIGVAVYRCETTAERLSCVASPDPGTSWDGVVDQYYRSVVPVALSGLGYPCLHGSAVASPSGALVLVGASHAGKTTLALGPHARGHKLVADDAVVMDSPAADDEGAYLLPVPFSVLASDPVADRTGAHLSGAVTWPTGPVPLAVPVPVLALIRLSRVRWDGNGAGDATTTQLRRLSGAQALRAVMDSSSLPEGSESSAAATRMRAFIRLAALVPVHELVYPDGYDRIYEAIDVLEALLQ